MWRSADKTPIIPKPGTFYVGDPPTHTHSFKILLLFFSFVFVLHCK